jgi:hypothetical protein
VLKQIINEEENPESDDKKAAESGQMDLKSGSSAKRSATPSATSGKHILSSDVEIRGKLRFSNDLILDGRIEGR